MHWFWRIALGLLAVEVYANFFGIPDLISSILLTTIPALIGIGVYALVTKRWGPVQRLDTETRCRKCGYILRGLTEPRCSECGERI